MKKNKAGALAREVGRPCDSACSIATFFVTTGRVEGVDRCDGCYVLSPATVCIGVSSDTTAARSRRLDHVAWLISGPVAWPETAVLL